MTYDSRIVAFGTHSPPVEQIGRFDHMTTTTTPANSLRSVMTWTAAIAIVWIVAAALRPETTLHLGPILLPLMPAFLLRNDDNANVGVLGGTAIGAGVLVLLQISGNLDGPALEPFTSVLAETFVLLAGASAAGFGIVWLSEKSR
jgi:hypothetical protein